METERKHVPEELENDAIIEALLEIRFDMQTVPEVFFGRLADHGPWKNYRQRRLPTYEIPPPVRQADANLRYQPVFELQSERKDRSVRVGAHVVSFHKMKPYGGWKHFRPDLSEVIDAVFSRSEGLTVRRLGLRYINAINEQLHNLTSLGDLDVELRIEGQQITQNVNLNFFREVTQDTRCMIRIATPSFIQGRYPENTSMIIDVDVFTRDDNFRVRSKSDVLSWIDIAHTKEKEQFFALLTQDKIDELRKR